MPELKLPPLDDATFEAAYGASGEKRLWLAQLVFPWLLGPAWRYALLAFAYTKLLDDDVDEERDTVRSLAVLQRHRELLAGAYAGAAPEPASHAERLGIALFAFDAANGSPLRRDLEAVIDSMEVDLRRRGRTLPRAEIVENLRRVGGGILRGMVWFPEPDLELPETLVDAISDAYLESDNLIDLEHDVGFGLDNVPLEDHTRGVDPSKPGATLDAWKRERARVCEARFEAAFRELRALPSWRLRVLLRVFVGNKRRKLRSHLKRSGIGR